MKPRWRFGLFLLAMALLGGFVALVLLEGGFGPALAWIFDGLWRFFAVITRGS